MNNKLEQMISRYQARNNTERINAIKEVLQEIVLCGLSRNGFFEEAAFYGGTALRIFHESGRFSEDLDFSLKNPNSDFDLNKYIDVLSDEIKSYGISATIEIKAKNIRTDVQSAYLSTNAREMILTFYPENDNVAMALNHNQNIKVKVDVDTNPPAGATYETVVKTGAIFYKTCLFDLPSLFAGKLGACLTRNWAHRVKGRDFYDFVFYINKRVKFNLDFLRSNLLKSGTISENDKFDLDTVKTMLKERFEMIDFESAKDDIKNFIGDYRELQLWNKDFFIALTTKLEAI